MVANRIRWTVLPGFALVTLATGQGAIAAPAPALVAPPPPIFVAPPAPPAPPPVNFGAAPAAAPAESWPADPKAQKALRKQRYADAPICTNAAELKQWMAKPKLEACDRVLAMAPDPVDAPGAVNGGGGVMGLLVKATPAPGTPAPSHVRAQWLQHRALALVNLGDNKNALAALDESDAIGKAWPDTLFDLSIGVGNTMLRAQALNAISKRTEALAQLEAMRAARPWSATVVATADSLEAGFTRDMKVAAERMAARQRKDPDVSRSLIYMYLMQGDLAQTAATAQRVSLVDPKMGGGWSLTGGQSEKDELFNRIRVEGVKAYTAAAQGDAARANALYAAARQSIDDYIGPDPALAADVKVKPPSRSKLEAFATRKLNGTGAKEMIGEWEAISQQRQSLAGLDFKTLMTQLGVHKHKADIVPGVVELLRKYGKDTPGEDGKTATIVSDGLMRQLLGSAVEIKPTELGPRLPLPETLAQVPKFASTASKWLFTDGSGYSQSKEEGGDVRTVRYESLVGSRAMVEELCLLAIANYARSEGKDGFIILSNRTLARQTTTYGMWAGGTTNSGFEAQARVRLVDSNALPADLADQKDRVILASEIEQQLKPRYDAYMVRKDAEAAARKAAKKS